MRVGTALLLSSIASVGLASMASAAEVSFNSDGTSLTQRVLDAMDRNVAAAGNKPVDFDVNLFAFTDDSIADKMLTLAAAHPNLTIKLVTDWSSMAESGGRKAPFLEYAAKGDYASACAVNGGDATSKAACRAHLQDVLGGHPLPNVLIHYKKDDPYRWDAASGRAIYDHNKTEGLDHHKGIAFVVDGVPTELLTGSFNWSPTGNDDNYENLMSFSRTNPAERTLIRQFAAEQSAMFHNAAVSLSGSDARIYRGWTIAKAKFDARAGDDPGPEPTPHLGTGDSYTAWCPTPGTTPTLSQISNAVHGAVAVMGDDFKNDPISAADGKLAINNATKSQLDAILPGIGKVYAGKITSWISAHGPMESLADLKAAGIPASTITKITPLIDLRFSQAFFSSHEIGCDQAGTGFAAINASETALVRNATGTGVTKVPSSLTAPSTDLFRRAQPGQTIKIAAYELGANAPEFTEAAAAVARGVKLQVVLNSQYSQPTVAALQALATANPGMVQVKLSKSHVMHEKFGLVGDDVFDGSSNLNPSSVGKHAEDRFLIKNDAELSGQFSDEFDRLWSKTTWAVGQPAT